MTARQAPTTRYFAALLIVFLAGCGPTRTAGTSGLAAKDLSVLSVAQLPAAAHIQIHTIQFDDAGDEYKVGKSHTFYLSPQKHTASFTLKADVPNVGMLGGIGGWFIPKDALIFPGPKGIPLGVLTAGKTYEFAAPIDGFEKMIQGGELSLVREKGK